MVRRKLSADTKYRRKVRLQRIKDNLCVDCGVNPPNGTTQACDECNNIRAIRKKAKVDLYKSKDCCRDCAKPAEKNPKTGKFYSQCAGCRKANLQRMKDRHQALKDNHQCTTCTKPLSPKDIEHKYSRCHACRLKKSPGDRVKAHKKYHDQKYLKSLEGKVAPKTAIRPSVASF